MEKLPVSNSGFGWLEPGCGTIESDQGGFVLTGQEPGARSHSPSYLAHLELASGAPGSQEVLTLHDSLNSELRFLGKGDEEGGVMGGGARGKVGDKEGCPRLVPLVAVGPEGGAGCDLRRAPTLRLGNWPGAHLNGTGLKAPLLGLGKPRLSLKGRNCLPIQESSVSIQEEG